MIDMLAAPLLEGKYKVWLLRATWLLLLPMLLIIWLISVRNT